MYEKLVTSTYTMNIMNDVKVKKDNKVFSDNLLEFCTAGNDIVSLWKIKQNGILESEDIKIRKTYEKEMEITALEYCYPPN